MKASPSNTFEKRKAIISYRLWMIRNVFTCPTDSLHPCTSCSKTETSRCCVDAWVHTVLLVCSRIFSTCLGERLWDLVLLYCAQLSLGCKVVQEIQPAWSSRKFVQAQSFPAKLILQLWSWRNHIAHDSISSASPDSFGSMKGLMMVSIMSCPQKGQSSARMPSSSSSTCKLVHFSSELPGRKTWHILTWITFMVHANAILYMQNIEICENALTLLKVQRMANWHSDLRQSRARLGCSTRRCCLVLQPCFLNMRSSRATVRAILFYEFPQAKHIINSCKLLYKSLWGFTTLCSR